jgi:hypothetical protein
MFNQQPQQFQSFNNFQQAPVQQMMQQPAQLPFNPQAPQYQAIQITVNNLPVNLMPLQNAVNPKLHPYLPGIAAACIDSIQSRAAQNPLRMFLFNQMASTNFTSQNFLVLLKVVCDISELYAVNGMVIEQAIGSAVDLSVQFAAFNNLQAFPGLQNYIDQNMMNNLQKLSEKQQMLTQQVMQYQQQRNNQMVLQVAHPSDLTLVDPPCLRSIDTRIQDDVLNFVVYFRSWDLWNGFPANLAAIRSALRRGFVVNLSTESRSEAARFTRRGYPTVCVVPEDAPAHFEHDGIRFRQCPATFDGSPTQCATCGGGTPLCARADRTFVVTFPVHGNRSATAATCLPALS